MNLPAFERFREWVQITRRRKRSKKPLIVPMVMVERGTPCEAVYHLAGTSQEINLNLPRSQRSLREIDMPRTHRTLMRSSNVEPALFGTASSRWPVNWGISGEPQEVAQGSLRGPLRKGLSRPLNDPEEMAREIRRLNRENAPASPARDLKKSREHTGRGPAAGYALIDQMRAIYRVVELCQALAVMVITDGTGVRLLLKIKRIHADRHTRCYGSPRMSWSSTSGVFAARLTDEAKCSKIACRGSSTSGSRRPGRIPAASSALQPSGRGSGPDRARVQIMVSVITYIPTRQGWLYLAVVMDLFEPRNSELHGVQEPGLRSGRFSPSPDQESSGRFSQSPLSFRSWLPVYQSPSAAAIERLWLNVPGTPCEAVATTSQGLRKRSI